MTQPTVIFFGSDISRQAEESPPPKVFLRTLLFSTGKRGRMIESMHVKVIRNETIQNFNIWVYGNEKLVRGSGLFVGESGVSANHHFLTPTDGNAFAFVAGNYRLELFAKVLGAQSEQKMWTQTLVISKEQEEALRNFGAGIYFDWGPDSQSYISHVEIRPPQPGPEDFLGILTSSKLTGTAPRS